MEEVVQDSQQNFDDEAIQKDLEFQSYYNDEQEHNILNIQNFFSKQEVFEEFLLHIYNLLGQQHPLSQKIHKYLSKVKNTLLDNKLKEIEQIKQDIISLDTDKLIIQGQQLGQKRCKQIIEQEIKRIKQNNNQTIQEENKVLRKKIQFESQQIVKLQQQIEKTLKPIQKINIDNHIFSALLKSKNVHKELQITLDNNKQIYQKQSQILGSLKSKIQPNNRKQKQPVIEHANITLNRTIINKYPQRKVTQQIDKYCVLDETTPIRVYWIICAIFVVVHILWRFYW